MNRLTCRIALGAAFSTSLALTLGTACSAPTADLSAIEADAQLIDVASPSDARASLDGSSALDAVAACVPADVSGFKPSYEPPPDVSPMGGCSTDQLDSLILACFDPTATSAMCNAWVSAKKNEDCLHCWSGPVTAASWAPVIYSTTPGGGQAIFVNTGGCIALSDPGQVTCAQNTEYALECVLAACSSSCPIPDTGDTMAASNALNTCIDAAATGGCAAFATPANQCAAALDPGDAGEAGSAWDAGDAEADPAAFCYSADTNPKDLLRYLTLACGPGAKRSPPPDGGPVVSDAQPDGPDGY
jgi:hypothetical protein